MRATIEAHTHDITPGKWTIHKRRQRKARHEPQNTRTQGHAPHEKRKSASRGPNSPRDQEATRASEPLGENRRQFAHPRTRERCAAIAETKDGTPDRYGSGYSGSRPSCRRSHQPLRPPCGEHKIGRKETPVIKRKQVRGSEDGAHCRMQGRLAQ